MRASRRIRHCRFSTDPNTHASLKSAARESFSSHLKTFEQMLDGQQWVMGDQYTVADGYGLLLYQWAGMAQFPVSELQALSAHKNRMLARPAVPRSWPGKAALLSKCE